MAGRRRKSAAGKVIFVILLVLFAVAGVYYLKNRKTTAMDYKEEQATVGDIHVTYSFTGEITAPNTQTIKAEAAGTIRDVYVESNQRVNKGERIIRMEDGQTYKADIAGEVIVLPVHKGDHVESDQTLVTVTNLERLEVEISIDEYDVEAVSIGMPVDISITALDRVCQGTIVGLNKQADTSGQIAYYTATVQLETVPGILPGMQVEAVLVRQSVENVVMIHAQALQFTEQNEAYVIIPDGLGGETISKVDTGLTDGILVEIRDGLAEGDTVYYVDHDTSFEDLMRAFGGSRRTNRNQ